MSPSVFSRPLAVTISAGCAIALASCSNEDTTQAGAPAFSEVQSTTDTADAPTSSATPAATSAPRSTSAADAEKQKLPQDSAPLAFAGMGTASLEDQQHMPEGSETSFPRVCEWGRTMGSPASSSTWRAKVNRAGLRPIPIARPNRHPESRLRSKEILSSTSALRERRGLLPQS